MRTSKAAEGSRPHRKARFADLKEATEAFVGLFDQVVAEQLISDVPVGLLQGGGIDSSLIAYSLANRDSFLLVTASFFEQSHDETAIAAIVAAQTSLPHRIVFISSDPDPAATLARVVHHFDGQVADESAGPLLLLTRELRRNSTVALSGDGADEFFGGYPTYRALRRLWPTRSGLDRAIDRPTRVFRSRRQRIEAAPGRTAVTVSARPGPWRPTCTRGMATIYSGVPDSSTLWARVTSSRAHQPDDRLSPRHRQCRRIGPSGSLSDRRPDLPPAARPSDED
ncbi:hypothetical protein I6F21_06315 [Bradyrhizobium sp. NBAIM03]|uniref:asparagine synthase-related protein n=1 Tax=Bradyrhizobium sp. NBAIM03 TaxID=2793816 RepID=UPI001CD6103B|nr:asparagine synthase-related protein [Bradyrhizobium sp. NBAIM03]MCA1532173.1 hypothetical protein [Bradyrhizobium sp. NBAIM03]